MEVFLFPDGSSLCHIDTKPVSTLILFLITASWLHLVGLIRRPTQGFLGSLLQSISAGPVQGGDGQFMIPEEEQWSHGVPCLPHLTKGTHTQYLSSFAQAFVPLFNKHVKELGGAAGEMTQHLTCCF